MRKGILLALAGILTSNTLAQAQQATDTAPKGIVADGKTLPAAAPISVVKRQPSITTIAQPTPDLSKQSVLPTDVSGCFNCAPERPLRAWVETDYLLWWVKGQPTNMPLVTTGVATDPIPAALGQPNTHVIYGGNPIGYGALSGVRLGGGIALNEFLAVEGSYFVLTQGASHYTAASNASGAPLIGRPFINNQFGGQDALLTSNPDPANGGPYFGSTTITSHTSLQGWELNLTSLTTLNDAWSFRSIVGFRALSLDEDLSFFSSVTPLAPGLLNVGFMPTNPPGLQTDFDHFNTSNRFYGGQVGGRFLWQQGNLSLAMTGKVGLGVTQQIATIDGASTNLLPGAPPVTLPGGLYAQTTNIGRYYHTNFSVVPEGLLNLGYNITPRIKATVGYTFLYWSQVARPGNQIDPHVNPALIPTGNFGFGTGANQPSFHFQESGFWAQGINFGLQFRF